MAEPILSLWSSRNALDFALRKLLGFAIRRGPVQPSPSDLKAASEVGDFLASFPWPLLLNDKTLRVVDIGCRNFFLAPEIDRLFRSRGWEPHVHGIELDAYRRTRDFRTRKQYGDFYSSQIPNGHYHPIDFLDWKDTYHIGLLLNPFVLKRSVLAWGLPLSILDPLKMVQHAASGLEEQGLLLIGSPTNEEWVEVSRLAEQAGLESIARAQWFPSTDSVQTRPRFGTLFRKGNQKGFRK